MQRLKDKIMMLLVTAHAFVTFGVVPDFFPVRPLGRLTNDDRGSGEVLLFFFIALLPVIIALAVKGMVDAVR